MLKNPLFRKFSSNFFAALVNLMMFLNFGLDNLNLEKNESCCPKGRRIEHPRMTKGVRRAIQIRFGFMVHGSEQELSVAATSLDET